MMADLHCKARFKRRTSHLLFLLISIRFGTCEVRHLNRASVFGQCHMFSYFCFTGSKLGYQYDSKAFLFSLVNKPGWKALKLPQTGGVYSYLRLHSIYNNPSYGPTFGGGHDLHVTSYASTSGGSYTNLGYSYSPPRGHNYRSTFTLGFLAGSSGFLADEVETFYESP